MKFTKYVLHFTIFVGFLLLFTASVKASGNIVEGSIKAEYQVYDDNSLSYTLNFEIENTTPDKYITSFEFSIPFKEYSALNVSTNDLQDYKVTPGEYNSILLNFARPLPYMARSSVYVNLTVSTVESNISGFRELDLVNPITGQNVYYTLAFPESYGSAYLSRDVSPSTITSQNQKISTFTSTENLKVTWRTSNMYSFRLKYTLLAEEGSDILVNLPAQDAGQSIQYSKMTGVIAGLKGHSNYYGVAKPGEVLIEASADIQSQESDTVSETEGIEVNEDSTFYKELAQEAQFKDRTKVLDYLKSSMNLNRGFKVSRDLTDVLWTKADSGEALNSFEAAMIISSSLNKAGVKAEVRYGYILDPFEINFPIAWVASEVGEINLFAEQFLGNQNPTKLIMGRVTNNVKDLALGVFGDTPEVVRIEPMSALTMPEQGEITITDTSANLVQISNKTNSIFTINKSELNGALNLIVNSFDRVIIPGENLIPINKAPGTLKIELSNGKILELTVLSSASYPVNTALDSVVKTSLLIAGGVIIFVLVFFVKKKNSKELTFVSQT